MNLEDLKHPFSEDLFLQLNEQLIDMDFKPSQLSISQDSSRLITKAKYYGKFDDLDLHVFVVEHSSTEDARVGVSMDIFKLMKKYSFQNALVAAYSNNSDNWRYSLVTSSLSINKDGRITKQFSNPRRYSFILGPDQKVLTPYNQLVQSGKVMDTKELSKRFSLEVVNDEFYKEIARLYDKLVGTDTVERLLTYPNTGDESHEFAVRLIGRIIFCWFLREKKSKAGKALVPSEILSREASNISGYYHNILAPLFFEALNRPVLKRRSDKFKTGVYSDIPYLNGGLFSDDEIDYYKFDKTLELSTPGLVDIPDTWLHELFDLLERFNFTVDENTAYDTDLSIDPEMLGRVFENLLARINPETGETVRKSTGSFYTPREIVDYMVDTSLSEFLKSKTEIKEDKIKALISYDVFDDVGNELNKEETISILQVLSSLTVLDPACGSGAFPIGMLQKIVFVISKLDPDAKWWLSKQLEGASPELRREFANRSVDYIRKLGVIRQTIFGIDIQPIATEISRLRCFLTLIVDEAIDDTEDNRGIRPLPNLEFKFVTANSLQGLPEQKFSNGHVQQDMFDNSQKEKIEKLKVLIGDYFIANHSDKSEIKAEYRYVQNQLWNDMHKSSAYGQQSLALTGWDPFVHMPSTWFDPEWMFGVDQGFDIVLANPPYISHDKIDNDSKNYIRDNYVSFEAFADLYCYFVERGINLSSNEGILCYITSNSYLKAEYGKPLRKFLNSNTTINQLIDIEDYQVFSSAIVNTAILVSQKGVKPNAKALIVNSSHTGEDTFQDFITKNSFYYPQDNFKMKTWSLAPQINIDITKKIESTGKTLQQLKTKIRLGLATGANDVFVINEQLVKSLVAKDARNAEIIKPVLKGRDIFRYHFNSPSSYILLTKNGINVRESYPTVYEYLDSQDEDFKQRGAQGVHWTNLRACAFFDDFKKEKIVWIELSDNGRFALSSDEVYLLNSAYFLLPPTGMSTKYLLGILNSRVIQYYLEQVAQTSGMGVSRWINNFVKDFPIPEADEVISNSIIECVSSIINEYSSENPDKSKIAKFEDEVDHMAYKLYGLTDEEITVIEGLNHARQ